MATLLENLNKLRKLEETVTLDEINYARDGSSMMENKLYYRALRLLKREGFKKGDVFTNPIMKNKELVGRILIVKLFPGEEGKPKMSDKLVKWLTRNATATDLNASGGKYAKFRFVDIPGPHTDQTVTQ